MGHVQKSYEVGWTAIDAFIDRLGGVPRMIDGPAWKWLGAPAEAMLQAGEAKCPLCGDHRPPRTLCLYCHRTHGQTALPRLHPRTLPVKVSDAKFRARVKAAKARREAKPAGAAA
jgi:hypothetical protein